ncbi:MAG: nitroreductase family deazaflavin-dependent oxidoreductase [Thermoplasmata archaeon]
MAHRFGFPRHISRTLNRRVLAFVTKSGFNSLITLETQGRKTGRSHRVVLPVYLVSSHRMFVVSSYGRRSDWLRNVLASPNVRITRGGQTQRGSARPITWEELRRGTRNVTTDLPWALRCLAPLVKTTFLVRARISGTVVEITA